MQTFTYGGIRIHHNSDGSEDAIIVDDLRRSKELRVPCDSLVAFVAELVRSRRIAEIEQMTAEEVLGIEEA
jgi:hypothetical protein